MATDFGLAKYKLEAEYFEDHVLLKECKSDLAAGQWMLQLSSKWNKTKMIGEGAFGKVWLYEGDCGSVRAIKQVPRASVKTKVNDIYFRRELQALAKLKKVIIAHIYDAIPFSY